MTSKYRLDIKYPKLRLEMLLHKDSQKSLGQVVGLSSNSIGNKLSGRQEWTIGEIEKICEYYKKDYYELFKEDYYEFLK